MRRLLRGLGWGRNPLRRGSDRIEGWLNLVLILVLLIAGTSLATHFSRSAYRADIRAAAWERAHRHVTLALLLEKPVGAPSAPVLQAGAPTAPVLTADARWSGPNHTVHGGRVPAGEANVAGDRIQIWVDDSGALTAPPARRRPVAEATQAAAAVVLILAIVLAAIRMIARRVLDRRRLRSWQAEWMEVGPRWCRYR